MAKIDVSAVSTGTTGSAKIERPRNGWVDTCLSQLEEKRGSLDASDLQYVQTLVVKRFEHGDRSITPSDLQRLKDIEKALSL